MKAALLFGAILIGGVAAGVVAERAGLISLVSDASIVAQLDEVPYHVCPDQAPVGNLHRGDRVYVTGITEDGLWAQVRAPYDTESRVFVRVRWVFPDTSIVGSTIVIPLCAGDDDAGGPPDDPGSTTTTTTPLPDDAPTSSSTSSSSSSTTTSSTTTSTSTSTTTTTTLPADSEGPTVNSFQSSEDHVWENAAYGGCPSQVQTFAVSAVVFDPSAIGSVQLSWSVGAANGNTSVPLVAPDIYSVTVGPFAESTLSGGSDEWISLQLTAFDGIGNPTSVSSSSFTLLHDCVLG